MTAHNFYQSLHIDMGGSAKQPGITWCKSLGTWVYRSLISTEGRAWPKQRAEETTMLSCNGSNWAGGTRVGSEKETVVSAPPIAGAWHRNRVGTHLHTGDEPVTQGFALDPASDHLEAIGSGSVEQHWGQKQ